MAGDADYRAQAEHWLNETEQRTSIDAGRECLATAGVYALLELASAIRHLGEKKES